MKRNTLVAAPGDMVLIIDDGPYKRQTGICTHVMTRNKQLIYSIALSRSNTDIQLQEGQFLSIEGVELPKYKTDWVCWVCSEDYEADLDVPLQQAEFQEAICSVCGKTKACSHIRSWHYLTKKKKKTS